MINLPFEEIIKIIVEKSQYSEAEIKQKVDAKLENLSGLISKEGAAHIIANELGINFSEMEKKLQISQIQAGMRNISLSVRVVQKYEKREFNTGERQGKVANLLIGDETGVTRLVMWNDQTDLFDKISENDTLKITNANARSAQNGRIELHLNDQSKIDLNPAGEEVSRPPQPQKDKKKISELSEQDSNVEIMGTIVQVFDPRFFEVDPNTGRRTRPASDGKFYDAQGNPITPDYSYVFNLIIDDGSSTIRIVCFRNQMASAVNLNHEDIIKFKDDISQFTDIKNHLLGQIIKIEGRVVKNDMFDRIELIASRVHMNPEPPISESDNQENKKPVADDVATVSDSKSTDVRDEETSNNENSSEDSLDDNLKPSEMEFDVPQEDVKFSDGNSLDSDSNETSSEEKTKESDSSSINELDGLDELEEIDEDDEI